VSPANKGLTVTKIRVILVPQDQLMYETGDARESLPTVSFPGQMIRYRSLCEMRRKVLEEDEKLYRGEIHIREVWEVVLTVEIDARDEGVTPRTWPLEEKEKSIENDLDAILESESVVGEQKSDKSRDFEFHIVPSPKDKTSKPKHNVGGVGFLSEYDELSIPTMNKGRCTNLTEGGGSKRSIFSRTNRAVTPGLLNSRRVMPMAMLSVPEVDDDEKTSHWESERWTDVSYASLPGIHSVSRRASVESVVSTLPGSMRKRSGLRRDEIIPPGKSKNDSSETNTLRDGMLKMESRMDKMSSAFEEVQSQTVAMLANLTEVLTEMKKTSSRTILSDNMSEALTEMKKNGAF